MAKLDLARMLESVNLVALPGGSFRRSDPLAGSFKAPLPPPADHAVQASGMQLPPPALAVHTTGASGLGYKLATINSTLHGVLTSSMTAKYYPVWILLICILGVGAGIGLLFYFDLDDRILQVLQWLDAQGWQASLLFVLIMAAAIVLLLPGVVFTMGAGFVFGVIEGTLLVVAGTALGSTLAFLIARYLLPERPSRWLMSHVRPAHLGEVIREEGWRMIMLTRLVPLFPFKLSNYFFGLTPVRLWDFVLGNLIGIIPLTVNNVYLGSIAADLTTLGQMESGRTPLQWTLYGIGFLLAVVGVVGLTRIARRALIRKIEKEDL